MNEAVVDHTWLREVHARLQELQEEIADAKARQAWTLQEEAEQELAQLRTSLAAVGGVGRHTRKHGNAERLRSAVTNAIRRSQQVVASLHPGLARYLQSTIETGTSLQYRPIGAECWSVRL